MDRRHLIAGLAVVVTAAALAPPATADHHFMSIREVFPGTALKPSTEYIELQMYAAGQNNTTGRSITVCSALGNCDMPQSLGGGNPPNGENQRTVLIGGDDFPSTVFPGVAPDYPVVLLPNQLDPLGGAICFNAVPTPDCVAWGSFPGAPAVSGTGTAAGAIPDGSSLERRINSGCATLLEPGDDTNQSATDFEFNGSPVPRPNSVTPSETPCNGTPATTDPETQIDKGPKKKIRKTKATFKFSSTGIGVTFECALDKKAFKPCTSPHTVKKLKKGKHTFKVVAIDANNNRDESAAKKTFKVLKK